MDEPTLGAEPSTELPFKLTPSAASQWVDELPVLNTVHTAEKIYRVLRSLSNLEIEPVLRFQLLERLNETVCLLPIALEKHFLDASFPLPKKEQKLAKLSTHLHRELASNYFLITKSELFSDSGTFAPIQITTIIERAFYSLSQEQLLIAQRYVACSARFWTQFYELLALAEQLDLLFLENQKEGPVDLLVKRILLFSLSNPNRFSQREIKELYLLFELHAELAQLDTQPSNNQSKKAGFFIELGYFQPPRHISRITPDSTVSALRYIHTNNLVEHLIDQFKVLLNTDNGSCLLSNKRMLGKVVRSLGAPERRKNTRTQSESPECTIISGLENIISFISSPDDTEKTKKIIKPVRASDLWNDIPDFDIIPLDTNNHQTNLFSNNERDENIASSALAKSKNKVANSDVWGKKPLSNPDLKIKGLGCKILDISTGGFHLLWIKEANASIKVSEIISISQAGHPIKTGVVRWIENNAELGLSFGIELLSPTNQVVIVSSPKQPESEIKGLLIPELPEKNIQQSILISPSKYKAGGWIDLKGKTTSKRYQLQKLLEASPSFNQFSLFKLDNS
jgi:hypothetical protein